MKNLIIRDPNMSTIKKGLDATYMIYRHFPIFRYNSFFPWQINLISNDLSRSLSFFWGEDTVGHSTASNRPSNAQNPNYNENWPCVTPKRKLRRPAVCQIVELATRPPLDGAAGDVCALYVCSGLVVWCSALLLCSTFSWVKNFDSDT